MEYECLSVVSGIKQYNVYIYGTKFLIIRSRKVDNPELSDNEAISLAYTKNLKSYI